MDFKEAVQSCLSKYATFSGRARRSEYWFFYLFYVIVASAVGTIASLLLGDTAASAFLTLVLLVFVLPILSAAVRRLHDIGKSGWSLLFVLIPFVGAILLLIWFCKDSQPGANQYGPNPKQENVPF